LKGELTFFRKQENSGNRSKEIIIAHEFVPEAVLEVLEHFEQVVRAMIKWMNTNLKRPS
jgi:hypothetical protein